MKNWLRVLTVIFMLLAYGKGVLEDTAAWTYLNAQVVQLCREGRYEEASLAGEKALKMAIDEFGQADPKLAVSLYDLAEVYSILGRYRSAEDLYKDALEVRQRIFGPKHPASIVPFGWLSL